MKKLNLSPKITSELDKISKDNITGASRLFQQFLAILPQIADELHPHKKRIKPFLLHLSEIICHLQPRMAPFFQLAHYLRQLAESDFDFEVIQSIFYALPHSFLRKFKREQESIICAALRRTAENKKILVHSRSAIVEAFLRKWLAEKPEREVWITESRPMKEGTRLAEALADAPGTVVLLVDDARRLALPRVDAVMLGADRVSETEVLNKIGSYSLASLARGQGRPVYVLAERVKFLPARLKMPEELVHEGGEVLPVDASDSQTLAFNYYFEATPVQLVDYFITFKGAITPDDLAALFSSGEWAAFAIRQAE